MSPDAPREKDREIGEFLSMPAPELGSVTPGSPKAGLLTRVFRPYVSPGRNSTKAVCPTCHMLLPYAIASGQLGGNIVAIVGARSSGKSNYFGVLLDALERRYANEVGFTIYDQETFSVSEMRSVSSKRLFRERYGHRLFTSTHKMAIDQSRSASQDRDLRIPLIYRLEFPKRFIHYFTRPFASANAMDLIIFDAAGEDLEDQDTLDRFCRYVVCASGIVFIIDPLQFSGIRAHLTDELKKRYAAIDVSPTEVVARVINLFETRSGLKVGQKIRVPVAFAFSKSDALKDALDLSSRILRDSRHVGGFDAEDATLLSEEVVECLKEWDGPQLVNLARSKFADHSFFALSALGQLPDENLKIHRISPFRIADPLLWILWKRGYIRAIS